MISSTETNHVIEESSPIIELIESSGVSSIRMIASALEMDVENVTIEIESLIQKGILHGYITEDRTRFFKTDVKISKAPSVRSNADEFVIQQPETRSSKYTMIAGLLSITSGFVARALLPLSEIAQSIGASLVLIGMAILAAGWLYLSKQTSSVKSV